MQIKQLFDDDQAVSPVIGVILMVAITVILAAVIGTFVLGLGDQVQSSAPNANFQFEYTDSGDGFEGSSPFSADSLTVTHNGGQDVEVSNIEVRVSGVSISALATGGTTGVTNAFSSSTISTGSAVTLEDNKDFDGSGSVTASEQFVAGDDVRVIWTSPNGDSSNTIGSSTVPS